MGASSLVLEHDRCELVGLGGIDDGADEGGGDAVGMCTLSLTSNRPLTSEGSLSGSKLSEAPPSRTIDSLSALFISVCGCP